MNMIINLLISWINVFVSGKLRYANNSNYKNDTMIRKEVIDQFSVNLTNVIYNKYSY